MSALFTKLRYKAGMRVCVLGAPSGFSSELTRLPKTIARASTLRGRFDLLHVFVTRQSEIARNVSKWKKALAPGGILWLSYPKGDTIGTDLKRDVLRIQLGEAGLDSVAQVAIDDVWSAIRFKNVDQE
jgi:hypothetical protein